MTTSGAWRPPPRSNRRVMMSLPTRPPPTMTRAPAAGPLTTGSADSVVGPGAPARLSRETSATMHNARRLHIIFASVLSGPPDLPDLLRRRRLWRRRRASARDELRDVVPQLPVLRRADVNHVARLVVSIRHAIDHLFVVREVREVELGAAHDGR